MSFVYQAFRLTVVTFFCIIVTSADAATDSLFHLAPTWTSIYDYSSVGGCASAPLSLGLSECNPARRTKLKETNGEIALFAAASDLVLDISKDFKQNKIDPKMLDLIVHSSGFKEVIAVPRVDFHTLYGSLSLIPYKAYGQYQMHNPNLPFASMRLQEDTVVQGSTGLAFELPDSVLSLGVRGSILHRKRTSLELSVAEILSKNNDEFIIKETLDGMFADAGVTFEWNQMLNVSVVVQDIGSYANPPLPAERFIYLQEDRLPRVLTSASIIPGNSFSSFQLGVHYYYYLEQSVNVENSFYLHAGYYMGPLRIMSAFKTDLLRSMLSLKFESFEWAIGQEWQNRVQSPYDTDKKFVMEISSKL